MKILFDTTPTLLGKGGTSVYILELLNALRTVNTTHEIGEFFCRVPYRGKNSIIRKAQTVWRDTVWQNVIMPMRINAADADLVHSPVMRTTLRYNVPLVVTALDFYFKRNPSVISGWASLYSSHLVKTLSNARAIVAISEFTKQELLYFYPSIPEKKIFVTPLGVSPKFQVADNSTIKSIRLKYKLDKPFMLSVNTLEPRKNLPAVIEAFERSMKQHNHDLVMIGSPGWVPEHMIELMNSVDKNPRIHYLGFVPHTDLIALYSAASFYTFPSLYEGFGLPILEAMACGCPVLTSKNSSLTEVAGNAAIFVNPNDIDDIARGMHECCNLNDKQRTNIITNGLARVKLFSWHNCAEKTLIAYEYAYNQNGKFKY